MIMYFGDVNKRYKSCGLQTGLARYLYCRTAYYYHRPPPLPPPAPIPNPTPTPVPLRCPPNCHRPLHLQPYKHVVMC